MRVAALFVCPTSPYWDLPGVECYDEQRDARTYLGGVPVIAHPPCRGWGQLRSMSKHLPAELELARFSVSVVRTWGGVLEHPARSTLWADQALPLPGRSDGYGYTMAIEQGDFGHRAPKATWLYVCGAGNYRPALPIVLGDRVCRVEWMGRAERERTPLPLARWLVDLASRCDCPTLPDQRDSVAAPVTPPLSLTGETFRGVGSC
jgi:hypothetical protein